MATFLSLLPLLLQILGVALKWYGASEDVLEKYKALVESTQESGMITVAAKDKIMAQRQKILDRLKAKKDSAGGIVPKA